MMFWVISISMAVLVALVLGRALWRGMPEAIVAPEAFDLQVYRDQLAEVERDVARGVIPAEDADRVRTEISRRILAADTEAQETVVVAHGPNTVALGGMLVVLLGGATALYYWLGQPGYGDMALADRLAYADTLRENRPSQQVAVDGLPAQPPLNVPAQLQSLLEQLRETVAGRPDDIQGQTLLAQYEANVGNFTAAAKAQARLLRLKGADAVTEDLADYAEMLVLAAGGYVSPEAETALRQVLSTERENGRAWYYVGLMHVQTGRPDLAFRIWDGLLRRGPEDALWIEPIRAQIMAVAQLAGVKYTLPEIGRSTRPGPSAEDIEAASGMTAAERMEMIGGMVAGLSDRLATEGGPPEDWGRLITSLGVLGRADEARAIFDNAMEVFDGDPGALDTIRAAGAQAGVAE